MKKRYSKEFYMEKALRQAVLAYNKNEVPVGAVIVDAHGNILSRAYNKVEGAKCQMAHAEVLAIKKACKKVGDWRLNGCSLYVTLEPCLMCLGLIQLSRIKKIVFGADSPLFGSIVSNQVDKKKAVNKRAKCIEIKRGICGTECARLLQSFFIKQRKLKGE